MWGCPCAFDVGVGSMAKLDKLNCKNRGQPPFSGNRAMQIARTAEKERSRPKRIGTSKNLKELRRPQDLGELVKDLADVKRRLRLLETRSDDPPAHLSGNVGDDKGSQAGARHRLEARMDKLLSFVDRLEQ